MSESAPRLYTGRFAPSPTGDLHFGSLVAAVGSYLQARSQGGRWLVRIEDIDPPREVSGSARRMLADLERLGMSWDGPVLHQSTRLDAYREALRQLLEQGDAFHCACTRSDLPTGGVYPGTCRNGLPPGRAARSVRLRVPDEWIGMTDAVAGPLARNLLAECGDFVIWRADGWPAYQLAVVVDDAWQGVTEVVRGRDLLDSTPRQVLLQRRLRLPTPGYLHLPLAVGEDARKLSKRSGADPLSRQPAHAALLAALRFLGQRPPELDSVAEIWEWAIPNWSRDRIPPGLEPARIPTARASSYTD